MTWFELAKVGHAANAPAGCNPASTTATRAIPNVRLPISTMRVPPAGSAVYGAFTNRPRPVSTWPSPTTAPLTAVSVPGTGAPAVKSTAYREPSRTK